MEKKKTFGRRDLILLLAVLVIGLIGIVILYTRPAALNGEVEVAVDGEVVMTLPLSEDTEVTIEGVDGGENLLVIRTVRPKLSLLPVRTGFVSVIMPSQETVKALSACPTGWL